MLVSHRRPVCLSWIAVDLPIWSTIETAATLYPREQGRLHLLLNQVTFPTSLADLDLNQKQQPQQAPRPQEGLLWLEISDSRVIMTMQGNGTQVGYRHFWERGIYGNSRYWLHNSQTHENDLLRLRNYTRSIQLEGKDVPSSLRVEYELWSNQMRLGCYLLLLEIQN